MLPTKALTRKLVIACTATLLTLVGATQASAQIVQSLQIGVGVFFPRGFSGRVAGDTLVADLTDTYPLAFSIGDFTGATINGEWNLSFGHHVEIGAGLGYYQRTVHSTYATLVNADGSEITQSLRLRITPITGVIRFMPFGKQGQFQPYVGAGVGFFNFNYSESGLFVDTTDFSIFPATFEAHGTAVGPILLGGVRIPIGGDIYGFATEYRYQWANGDTGGLPAGFLGPKIDLSGGTLNFTFLVRF